MSDTYDRETGEIYVEQEPRLPVAALKMQPLASLETTEVCAALAKAQGEFEPPKRIKSATIIPREGRSYSYSYAPLEEIIRVVQKPMAENGLSRQQYIVQRAGQWFVRTIIWHLSGQWISSDYPIFAEGMTAHKFASGCTYAKRQGLSLALGLAPEDDDDANVADAQQTSIAGRDSAKEMQKPNEAVDRKIARQKINIVEQLIYKALTVPDLISITGDHNLPPSSEWRDMTDEVNRVSEAKVANGVFNSLRSKIEKRREMILGENLHPGEMG